MKNLTFSKVSMSVTVLALLAVFGLAGCGGGGGSSSNDTGASYSISGIITDSSSVAMSGVTVALTGTGTSSTTTDSSGNYSFTGLTNGSYTVTPSMTGYTFNPSSTAVTVSGADVAGQDFMGSVIQTTTAIQGNLIVPSGDSAINYTVVNSYGSTTPDSSGNITTVQVSVSKPTATYAVSDTSKKVYATISTDTQGTLNLNAQTTAETLVLLNPFLITGNSEDYKKVISVVKSDPAVSSLASTIESVYASSADPLSDDRIKTALADAVKSVLTTLQNNGTLAKITPTTSKSLNKKTKTASLATGDSCGWASSVSANTLYICNYDMGALTTQNSSGSAIKLELNDVGPGGIRTNVTWVADIVELDASKIPDFINGNLAYSDHNLENYIKNNGFSERVIVPGELAGGALGVALSGDIFGVIGDAISSAVISDEGVVLPNAGIYAIVAYSGSYWGDDNEYNAVKASSWQKERWKYALQVNIASIALDTLGLVLDLSNMPDEGNKALTVKAAEEVASLSLKIDQEIVNQGGLSTTFLSLTIQEVFTALYEVAKQYTLTQVSDANASLLKTFFDTTLKTISDVYSGSVAVTNIGTRILNLLYNVTPRESAVVGYGNYWESVSYFKINSDASSTTSRTVTLNNTATGSPTHYMASESSTFSGAGWQTYSTAPSFTLSSGNATKTVYFKVKNSAGTESTVVSDSISLNEAATSQYTLTVSKSGTGSGTVTSNTGGISCGSTCSASYNSGTSVTLTASASSGSTFAGWSGGGCSGTGTCTVTMNAATTVTATFNGGSLPTSFTLTGSAQCNGSSPYISLSGWGSSGATTFDLYRNGSLYSSANTGSTFSNTSVTAGTTYSYYVVAKNSYGSTTSNTISVTASTCGGTGPTSFTLSGTAQCSGSSSEILLSGWGSSGATTFDLYRNGSLYSSANTGSTFSNTSVTAGTTYSYYVVAKNSYGSTTSNTISVTASTCGGTGPTSFTLTGTAQCSGSSPEIMLSGWGSSGATTFDLYRNGSLYSSANTGSTFSNTSVTAGTTYSYYVVAKNSYGSTTSNTISVTALTCGGTQVERITNFSFSSGTSGWTLSGDFWAGTNLTRYYTSPGYASGGVDSSGSTKLNASGSMYQAVTIPSTATSATLTFWLNITSDEGTTTTQYDKLFVEVLNSSGSVLATLATYSNLDKGSACGTTCTYNQKSFNLTSYKGQAIRIQFRATTDSASDTVFRIDDVSLMADGN